jgi:hypothetical protein
VPNPNNHHLLNEVSENKITLNVPTVNGNFDLTRMPDQSNVSTQRWRLIFWVEDRMQSWCLFGFGKDYNT